MAPSGAVHERSKVVVVLDSAELRDGAAGFVRKEKVSQEELVFSLLPTVSARVRTRA